MNHLGQLAVNLSEQGLFPDFVLRRAIRLLVKHRLAELDGRSRQDCDARGGIYRLDAEGSYRAGSRESQ